MLRVALFEGEVLAKHLVVIRSAIEHSSLVSDLLYLEGGKHLDNVDTVIETETKGVLTKTRSNMIASCRCQKDVVQMFTFFW